MARKKRELQEINAGSMADIAFLLLVFFLVTTTMDTSWGLARRLPPPLLDNVEKPPPIKDRNVFVVLANANDQLLAVIRDRRSIASLQWNRAAGADTVNLFNSWAALLHTRVSGR